MAFGINVYNLASITSYERAVQHFEDTPVPRTRKASIWGSDCRPLYNTRSTHFTLERGNYIDKNRDAHEYYQCSLYGTPMVRYFKPDSNGDHAVWLQAYHTASSWKFLWRMGWHWRKSIRTTAGDSVLIMPQSGSQALRAIWGDNFTTRMVLKGGALDLTRSVAVPWYRRVSSEGIRALRAEARQKLSTVLSMVDLRYQDILNVCSLDWQYMHRFSGTHTNHSKRLHASELLRLYLNAGDSLEPEDLADALQHTIEFAQEHALELAKRMLTQAFVNNRFGYTHRDLVAGTMLLDMPEQVQCVCTPKQEAIRKSVERELLMMARIDAPDERKPLAMFPATAPHTIVAMRDASDLEEDTARALTERCGLVY